jgi:hypothetical protein
LDEKKRPLEMPRLPDWARPKVCQPPRHCRAGGQNGANNQQKQNGAGSPRNGRGGLFREELLGHLKDLCETVGFSLSASVLKAVGDVDDAAKIRDMARLTAVLEKLQDLARGVERLRAAIGKVGERRYSELCREMNLVSDSIDDVPDRATLRRLLEMLEREAGANQPPTSAAKASARRIRR